MNIALINSPVRINDRPRNIPIGLGILAAILLEEGHTVDFIDFNAHRGLIDDLDQVIAGLAHCQIIGISGLITTYAFQKKLINQIKATFPEKLVLSGGGLATSTPELLFQKTAVDAVCLGEGEQTLSELAARLQAGRSIEDIDGLWLRTKSGIAKSPPRELIADLDSLPNPAYHLIDMEVYLNNHKWSKDEGRSANIITSRGCPFDCSFCYHIFGRKIRFRSVENIHKELLFLKQNYNIDYVAIVDDNATVNKKRVHKICDMMETEGLKWGCHGRVDCASAEMFTRMKASGCNFLGFGIESGSTKILKNIRKGTTKTQMSFALTLQSEAGFGGNSFIFGAPGENLWTIIESALFYAKNGISSTHSFIMTAYPGTHLYDTAVKAGRIDPKFLEEYVLQLGDAT